MKVFVFLLILLLMPQSVTAQNIRMGDINAMAVSIFYEARGEPVAGQRAVFDVIMNRVKSPRWPNTIYEVVYQKDQFSWTKSMPTEHYNNQTFKIIKERVLRWLNTERTTNANHYHSVSVHPTWADHMRRVGKIGNHIFYVG